MPLKIIFMAPPGCRVIEPRITQNLCRTSGKIAWRNVICYNRDMLRPVITAALILILSSRLLSMSAGPQSASNLESSGSQLLKLGAELLQRGQAEQAIRELKKGVALDPDSAAGHLLLGQAYLALRSLGMVAEAKAEFQQALSIDPGLIWARFYLAKVYIDQGRSDKAKEELERGLETRPDVPHFLSLLGEVNRKLGRPDLSIELNQRAMKADPSLTPAHYFMGLAYMDLKKPEDAARELESAVRSPYVAPEMYLTLGSLYAGKKKYEEGEELVKKAIALDPSRPEGHINLAQLYNLKGLGDLAIRELHLALPEGKGLPSSQYYQQLQADAFFELGRAYESKKKTAHAIQAYNNALGFNSGEGRTHARLAELYAESGDYGRAVQHLAMAEKLGTPVSAAARQAIQKGREESPSRPR
jgi:tetratricopeptide (TPR) repeat protein